MKENQEELDKEMTDAQPEPEIDVEAAEDSGISEAEAEEFETAKLKAELEEMEDRYLRARAEIANMANRGKNEREQLQKYRSQDLAKKLLPSIDNLERALATEVSDDQGAGLKKAWKWSWKVCVTHWKKKELKKSLLKEKPLILIFIKQYKLFQRLKIHQPIRL